MSAQDEYLIGIAFCIGYQVPCISLDTAKDYLTRAANDGEARASKIINSSNILYYSIVDGIKLGIKDAYDLMIGPTGYSKLSNFIPANDVLNYNYALNHFSAKKVNIILTDEDFLEFGLRYYVGDMTGRKNKSKGSEWLHRANSRGNKTAMRLLTSSNIEELANYEAVTRYGSIRALNRVTNWHKNGELSISDSDMIEFAKAVIRMGNNL